MMPLLRLAAFGLVTLSSLSAIVPMSDRAIAAPPTVSEQVYDKASPAVVAIETQDGRGSGVIIRPDGLILTNSHVVSGDQTVTITLKDGRQLTAEVIAKGSDCLDLALLRVKGQTGLPVLPIANSTEFHPGQPVFAIGNPRGYSGSFTQGIISRLDPSKGYIQTDVPLNPGNSGGPLLNSEGALIGINTSIEENSQAISFSVALDRVQGFLKDYDAGRLSQTGEPAAKQSPRQLSGGREVITDRLAKGDRMTCTDRSWYDRYHFPAKAGQAFIIRMESDQFLPYLALLSPSGEAIATDDNKPKDNYAILIQNFAENGTYSIIANSKTPGEGTYKLEITPLLLWRVDTLQTGDPTTQEGTFYRQYSFQGQANQTVQINAYSSEFNVKVVVTDTQGNRIDENRDRTATDKNAELMIKLPQTGTYTLMIASEERGKGGKFGVAVK